MQQYNIDLIHSKQFDDLSLDAWKMNIIVFDLQRQILAVGCKTYLQFFTIGGLEIIKKDKVTINSEDMINQIKQHGNLLFATTMNSWIYIYDLDNLQVKPILLQGLYEGISDCSIWSIDICDQYLAVGSNSHIISLWSRIRLAFDAPDHSSWDDREIRVKYSKEDLSNKDVQFPIRYSIQNHKHNIPCVEFSPCCKYIGSGSIDSILRIYLVENGTQLYQLQFSEWVWSIQWINIEESSEEEDNEEQSIEQYEIIVGFQNTLEICVFKNEKLHHEAQLFQHTSQTNQRYQKLHYLENLNVLFAVPQHDRQLCYIEIFKKYRLVKSVNLSIDLGNQNLLCADVKPIENSCSVLIATLTWQKQISLYRMNIV